MTEYINISFKEFNNLKDTKGAYRVLEKNGNYIQYIVDGKLHRTDGPAVIWRDGGVVYFIQGNIHRLDGPAMIEGDGEKFFYINDEELGITQFLKRVPKDKLNLFLLNPENF